MELVLENYEALRFVFDLAISIYILKSKTFNNSRKMSEQKYVCYGYLTRIRNMLYNNKPRFGKHITLQNQIKGALQYCTNSQLKHSKYNLQHSYEAKKFYRLNMSDEIATWGKQLSNSVVRDMINLAPFETYCDEVDLRYNKFFKK